jgi:uncharacterized protein (TIGR02145 family)
MKNLLTLFLINLIALTILAQAPQKFAYQSVIRNAGNQLVANQSVGIKISILQGSANGAAVYAETHSALTNANGLATLEIGGGTVQSGNFGNINWASGPYFVKTETDVNGGSNYTLTSTTQLLSVPYALYASSANTANTATTAGNGVPAGGTNGQFLTNCNGVPTWTTAGQCPGTIAGLNCAGASNSGSLTANQPAASVSSNIPYTGGGGGTHSGQTISSTGVTGLTATLTAGTFASGAGSLSYAITGTPTTSGIASFALSIGGQNCLLNFPVSSDSQISINAHSCGVENVHNSNLSYVTMTDQQGNVYKTIVIGTQEWMAENLKTSIYRNGEAIANVTDGNQWQLLNSGAWCYNNNNILYECPYGKLYNWYAVTDQRNLCPTGWHIPTDLEWTTLLDFLGGVNAAGGKMKTAGIDFWENSNELATNESGFSGLPGGLRSQNFSGIFIGVTTSGYWWSFSEASPTFANHLNLVYSAGESNYSSIYKTYGLSVRCLKD